MRSIHKKIIVEKSQEEVFNSFIKPSQIKKWWSAISAIVLPEKDGTYVVSWGESEDHPEYISMATILEIDPPKRLVLSYDKYWTKFGRLPFEANLQVSFQFEPEGQNTLVSLVQTGFPDAAIADEFYQGCIKGWDDTMFSFKKTIEQKSK